MNERKELIERLRSYGPGVLGGPVMAQAADMLEADAKPAVPQEPVRNDMSIQLLERLIKTLTNLGCATPEGGIEAFNADLPTQLYHLCFGVDRVLSALKTAVPQEPVAWYEYNADLDAWFLAYGHNPKAKTRPLVFGDAAPQPQQPRLTDGEVYTAYIA